MTREEIIERLQELTLDQEEYWVVAGGAMVLHGIKDETLGIELGCSTKLADMLENRGYHMSTAPDGRRSLIFDEDIEIFENWIFDHVEKVEEIPVISMKGLVEMKKDLTRKKDIYDVKIFDNYLSTAAK